MGRANPCGQYGSNVSKPDPTSCEGVDCGEGKICVNGQCVPDPNDPCYNVICPLGYTCKNGQCVPIDPCANVVCPPGQVCQDGQCVTEVTEIIYPRKSDNTYNLDFLGNETWLIGPVTEAMKNIETYFAMHPDATWKIQPEFELVNLPNVPWDGNVTSISWNGVRGQWLNMTKFKFQLNAAFNNTADEWEAVITHEFLHGLGFGQWKYSAVANFLGITVVDAGQSYLSSTDFPNALAQYQSDHLSAAIITPLYYNASQTGSHLSHFPPTSQNNTYNGIVHPGFDNLMGPAANATTRTFIDKQITETMKAFGYVVTRNPDQRAAKQLTFPANFVCGGIINEEEGN